MFEAKDLMQYQDGISIKVFEWFKINIVCELRATRNQTSEWSFMISGINGFAEEELQLWYNIGPTCTKRTLSIAMKKMFNNPYKDAYHKIIKGVLCGEVINNVLFLGAK